MLCKGPKVVLERVPRLLDRARLLVRVFRKVREEGGGREEEEFGLETTAYKSPEAGCRCVNGSFRKYSTCKSVFLHVTDTNRKVQVAPGEGRGSVARCRERCHRRQVEASQQL